MNRIIDSVTPVIAQTDLPATATIAAETANRSVDYAGSSLAIMGGAVVGGAIGAWLENRSIKKIEENRQAISETYGDIVEESVSTNKRKIRGAAASMFALGGAVLGGVNSGIWLESESNQVEDPTVAIVADKSGASLSGDARAANTVNDVLVALDGEDYNTSTFVANANSVQTGLELQEMVDLRPFGPAPMEQAFKNALGQARALDESVETDGSNTATVAITNGNTIGTEELVTEEDDPVFVFDVSEGSENAEQFEAIAEKTGGEYYQMPAEVKSDEAAAELDKTINELIESISEAQQEGSSAPNWPLRIFVGAGSLAMAAGFNRIRPQLTTNYDLKNVRK